MQPSLEPLLDLSQLKLPPFPKVAKIEWTPFVDHVGDNAYYVTVILPDDTPAEQRERRLTRAIEDTIRDAVRAAGIEDFVYTRTLTQADLKEAEEIAAAEEAEDELKQEQKI